MDISENRKEKKKPKEDKFLDTVDSFLFFYGDNLIKWIFFTGITIILFFGVRSAARFLKNSEEYTANNYVYQVGDIIERNDDSTFNIYNYLDSISAEEHSLELFIRNDNSIYKIGDIKPSIVLFKDDKSAAKLILKSKQLARHNYASANKLSSIGYILEGKLEDRDTLIIQANLDYIGKYIKIKRVD